MQYLILRIFNDFFQCSKRYEELLYNKDCMFPNMTSTEFLGLPPVSRAKTIDAEILASRKNNVSRLGSAKNKGELLLFVEIFS